MCQWGINVNPTKDGGVNKQLLCRSPGTPTGIHLTVRRSVTLHRETLMDSPSILPFLLSLSASLSSALLPPSVCHLLHPFKFPTPMPPCVQFDFTLLPQLLHILLSVVFGLLGTEVWLSGCARKHRTKKKRSFSEKWILIYQFSQSICCGNMRAQVNFVAILILGITLNFKGKYFVAHYRPPVVAYRH